MTKINFTKQEVLDYHAKFPAGKVGSAITKPLHTPRDLIAAYTPGVGIVAEAIAEDHNQVYRYTGKGNSVAIISNGTAVLGYGAIGPLAAKPVMEAKAMILKRFAGIDAVDIEIDARDPEQMTQIIKAISPTFGGLNLEDIKAPECFQIEESLIQQLSMPVMHDDQHATAIVTCSAVVNGLLVANKNLNEAQIVFSGAGAGAVATAKLLMSLGAKPEHIVMCDRQGVIRKDRQELSPIKLPFATDRAVHTLHDALVGADVFIGLSSGNILMADSVVKMNVNPLVFGLANPTPEISYEAAMSARGDVLFATGRGDYPNQVNNLLVFPYIFRGALDVGATSINEAMKQAAVYAIAELAKTEVPVCFRKFYGDHMHFGKTYLLPKPMDERLLTEVSTAVAKAAMESGVAQHAILDWDQYLAQLRERVGLT